MTLESQTRRRTLLAGCVALCCLMVAAVGAETLTDHAPQAAEILHAAAATMRALPHYTVSLRWQSRYRQGDVVQLAADTRTLAVARPDRLALRTQAGSSALRVACNGEECFAYQGIMQQYCLTPAAEDLADLWQAPGPARETLELAFPAVEELVTGNFDRYLSDEEMPVRYLGENDADGLTLRGVGLTAPEADVELWFQQDDQDRVLLRRLVLDFDRYLSQLMAEQPTAPMLAYRQEYDLGPWSFDEPDAAAFAFEPPPDAERVFLFGRHGPRHPLLGQTASDFSVTTMDGAERTLLPHLGRDILVLDFWAVRCPPCRAGLPLLTELTDEYADDGVVFWAVNVEDTPARIVSFMEELGISPTTVRDLNGLGARHYQVSGIPQTVIIGRDGTIQSVHVGFDPGTIRRLRAELAALVAGHSLVADAPAPRRADLGCVEVSLEPATSLVAAQPATARFILENRGPDDMPAGAYTLLLTINGQESYVGVGRAALPAGQELVVTIPAEEWRAELLTPGQYRLQGVIFGSETLVDRNMMNNAARGLATVQQP